METNNKAGKRALDKLQASSTGTPTPAGPKTSKPEAANPRVIDAVNQMFAEFELAYHNQYHKAFPTAEKLQLAKRLWYGYVKYYTPEQILEASRETIKSSEFLPTVRSLLKFLDQATNAIGLPSPEAAYHEVCLSTDPRTLWSWSHPGVYYAGCNTGWYILDNEDKSTSWPKFQEAYRQICKAVAAGEQFSITTPPALPDDSSHVLTCEEALQQIEEFEKQQQ